MDVLRMIKGLSAAELREMGEALIEFSENRDDPKWVTALDATIARLETPEQRGMAEALKQARSASSLTVS